MLFKEPTSDFLCRLINTSVGGAEGRGGGVEGIMYKGGEACHNELLQHICGRLCCTLPELSVFLFFSFCSLLVFKPKICAAIFVWIYAKSASLFFLVFCSVFFFSFFIFVLCFFSVGTFAATSLRIQVASFGKWKIKREIGKFLAPNWAFKPWLSLFAAISLSQAARLPRSVPDPLCGQAFFDF